MLQRGAGNPLGPGSTAIITSSKERRAGPSAQHVPDRATIFDPTHPPSTQTFSSSPKKILSRNKRNTRNLVVVSNTNKTLATLKVTVFPQTRHNKNKRLRPPKTSSPPLDSRPQKPNGTSRDSLQFSRHLEFSRYLNWTIPRIPNYATLGISRLLKKPD